MSKIQKFLIILFLISNVYAQETIHLNDIPSKWKYSDENNSGEWFDLKFYKMNASELSDFNKFKEKLAQYFGTQPVISTFKGINLNAHARCMYNHYDHELYPVQQSELIKPNLFIQFCSILELNGTPFDGCMEVPYIEIRGNYPGSAFESGMPVSVEFANTETGRKMNEMFYQPDTMFDLGDNVYLFDFYYENIIIIAKRNTPFWVPVTTKEYINNYFEFFKLSFDKNDPIYELGLSTIEKEIAMVSEDMMDKPAFVSNYFDDRILLGICKPEETGARQIFKFNPEYFNTKLPRSKIQLITITFPGNLDDESMETENSRLYILQLIKSLKGSDLRKLLDVE